MDYEAARHVLSSPADLRSLKAADTFLKSNIEQLKRCDQAPTGPLRAGAESVGKAGRSGGAGGVDAESVAAGGKISKEAAAFAISQSLGSESVDEVIKVAAQGHCSVVSFVTELIKQFDEYSDADDQHLLANKYVPQILADEGFFPRIFAAIGAGTLPEKTLTALLDLVFTALFYVIPDSSLLIVDFIQKAAGPSGFFANFSPPNRARGLLIVLQFLNVHQDFSFANAGFSYFKDGAALVTLHATLEAAPASVGIAWALVLHAVALRYSERPDKTLSGLLEVCRAKGGDELATRSGELLEHSLTCGGLAELVALTSQAGPGLVPTQPVSQTVADVLQALCRCVYVSHTLACAIDEVLAPWPVLARGFFADEFVATAVELAKAKVPAALPSFVHLARAIGPAAYELVAQMGSFIDEVDASKLEIAGDRATSRAPLTLLPPRASDGQGAIVLPAHSEGQLLGDGERPLVMWTFQYNGWSLLARVLEGSTETTGQAVEPLAIVRLMTTVLRALDSEAADRLLGALSASLARGDIIELLGQRFENAMGDFSRVAECTVLLEFFTALTPVLPHRVWTQLARSRLLEQRGEAGFVATVVGAVEIFATRYDFTLQIVSLVEVLLANLDPSNGLQTEVLTKLLRHLVNVFESLPYWSYADSRQRDALNTQIVRVFIAVVQNAGALADLLLGQLLAAGAAGERAIQPLLAGLADATDPSFFKLCVWLVRARTARNLPYSLLERKLYDAASSLVVTYCRHPQLRAPVLAVFEALVATDGPEQPSLLAYLGGTGSQLLLDALVRTARSDLELDDALEALASFFSAVARSQQEGLFILLASGKDVQNGSKNSSPRSAGTVLSALESLALRDLSPRVLAKVLEALAEAHSSNESVVARAIDLVNNAFTEVFVPTVDGAYRMLVVARSLQILAALIFQERQSAALSGFVKSMTQERLAEFSRRAFSVHGFDADLHEYVHSQFLKLKPAEQPKQLSPAEYGPNFTYSLSHLDKCLRHTPEWAALRPQVAQANINLSFISAQTDLVRYWRAWCMAALARGQLAGELAAVAEVALHANLADLTVPYFAAGAEMRVDLAFCILHRLHAANKLAPSLDVLQSTLRLLSGQELGIHTAVTSPDALRSYKYLLRIVNLELSLFVAKPVASEKLTEHLLALLDRVVICDARVIALQTTCATAASTAEIFVEIILCLRQSLTLLSCGNSTAQNLLQSMLDTGADRAVARLYSYALDLQPEDPVLGELALLYFLEWLPLSVMADHFVANGLLTALLEAPLSRKIQAGNVVASVQPRLHSVWQRGLLMLMLVLLQQLGSRVVPEAALFIESFEPQIDTCWQQWIQPTGEISIALIGETFLISILLASLASHGRHDALARVLPKNELLQAIDHLSSHRKYLATRVTACDDNLDVVVEEMIDLRNVISQR